MIVQNSGYLNGYVNGDGFGFQAQKTGCIYYLEKKLILKSRSMTGSGGSKVSIPIEQNKVT